MKNNNHLSINTRNEREFAGHNLFDQIENPLHRTWNQCMMYLNLYGRKGRKFADDYLSHLGDKGDQQVKRLIQRIRHLGLDHVRREVQRVI